MLQRYLTVWLVLSSLLAYFWNDLFAQYGWIDPFSRSWGGSCLPALIVVTMFCIGWMLPRDEVQQVVQQWPSVVSGTMIQYGSMPLLSYLCGRLFQLQGDHLIGIILVGSVPGAMASNVLTLLARGNASYSVSLTTLATICSPLAVPLALKLLLGLTGSVDSAIFVQSSFQLMWQVVLPVVGGYLWGRWHPAWEQAAGRIGSTLANLAILIIIAIVVGLNRQYLTEIPPRLLAALLLLNVAGYLAGYVGGVVLRLPEGMRRALTLEIGMQNAGLGSVLAVTLFSPQAAIAPALYAFGCMLSGTLLARHWASRDGGRL